MRLLYTFFIYLFTFGIAIVSLINPKAAQWIKGRKQWRRKLASSLDKSEEWIWVHAASLGEFEQGRPLIEAMKKQYPNYKILLSFFSPSGYEIRKNYPLADYVTYLPADTPKNARDFIAAIPLKLVVFIKYEFWFNYMYELQRQQIPLMFISVKLSSDTWFFKSYAASFLEQLKKVDKFFVQDEATADILRSHTINQVEIAGDTRFDRVMELAHQLQRFPEIEAFIQGRKAIVIGSSWVEDDQYLVKALEHLPEEYCVIIAPHEVDEKRINELENTFTFASKRYSGKDFSSDNKLLIIDTIGILSALYQYAYFAYVGGGFGKSIHNIQEAVAYGCPVIIGPNYKKFNEAVDLVQLGGVIAVENDKQMIAAFTDFVTNPEKCQYASEICSAYAAKNTGATQKIMQSLVKYL